LVGVKLAGCYTQLLRFLVNAVCASFSRSGLCLGLLALLCLGFAEPIHAQAAKRNYRPDRLIIMPKQGSASPALHAMHARTGRRVLNAYHQLGDMQVVQLAPGETVEEAVLNYLSSGLVEFAEPDYKLHATVAPNDPEFSKQWSLRNISAPGHDINAVAGWDTLHDASNIIVAIIDSGIRYTHNDLAANIWTNPKETADNNLDDDGNGVVDDIHGFNAIDGSGNVMDDYGHGTHVAGIIGAVGNNGIGISGVAWKVQLMACKFLDNTGDGETSDAIRCIDYARKNGAHIINASWGGTNDSTALYVAIANARAAGIIFVTAAGNDAENIDNIPLYPASYDLDNIVTVAGTGPSDTLDLSYSSYGAMSVDLAAPGTLIHSTWNESDFDYRDSSGTSMAAPHVAGALALMKARFKGMTYSQLISRLLSTVDVLPALAGKCKTSGRLNLARALGSDPTANFVASKLNGEPPLAVSFTNMTLGATKSVLWDFGDGTPVSTNSSPTHVFAGVGQFNVRLTVIGTNGRTNSFDQPVQVTANYEIISERYTWIDAAGLAPLGLADNAVSQPLPLPFPFQFYGQIYGTIYVGANGILGFNPAGMDTTGNTNVPQGVPPNGIICPYWDNLNPAAGGNVYAGYVGESPSRKFVASWVNVPRNSTAVAITFQAILEEGSSEIVFQYQDTQPSTSRGGAKRATVGVEDSTGTTATLYTYNGVPHVLTNQMALRLRPKSYRYLVLGTSPVHLTTPFGFPVSGASASVHLGNPGTLALDWTLSSSDPWLKLSQSSGHLTAGGSSDVPVSLSSAAEGLARGRYTGSLTLKNVSDGNGDSEIPVELIVEEPRSVLAFGSLSGVNFLGGLGGPFNPSNLVFELKNTGNILLSWTSSADMPWVSIKPALGAIPPGATENVTITLTAAAETFGSGTNTAVLRFENKTGDGTALSQSVQVQVRSRLEPTATVTDGIFDGVLIAPREGPYELEFSEDLETWIPANATLDVSGTIVKFQDLVNFGDRRFYRLRVD
jgi:subtilisin family serine protease